MGRRHLAISFAVVFCAVAMGKADVLHMPAGLTSLETVHVGDAGNAPDARPQTDGTGYGVVSYEYNIGKYEVTAGQYTEFLNAVAGTDTYALYNPYMLSDGGCHIQRNGEFGSYTYSVAADWANRPVDYVSFWDACRFANWLQNGQPTGPEGSGTTETGAYTLTPSGLVSGLIPRNANWQWGVTTSSEWYKAAYYDPHKPGGAGYWLYPTATDVPPSNELVDPVDPGNNATFCDGFYSTDPADYTAGTTYWRTEVGSHENSESPYGTYDQGGNVWEWCDGFNARLSDDSRSYSGGGSLTSVEYMRSRPTDLDAVQAVTYEYRDLGFRIVQIPEPASVLILAMGGAAILRRRGGAGARSSR